MGTAKDTLKPILLWISLGCLIILGAAAVLLVLFYLDNPGEDAPYAIGLGAVFSSSAFCVAEEQWCKLRSRTLPDPGTQIAIVLLCTASCLILHFLLQPPFSFEDVLQFWNAQFSQ